MVSAKMFALQRDKRSKMPQLSYKHKRNNSFQFKLVLVKKLEKEKTLIVKNETSSKWFGMRQSLYVMRHHMK
jgi:hypothetical protein